MNWLRLHSNAFMAAFRHLLKSPGNFLLNVLVVSVALALPFAGLTVLENIRPLSGQLAVNPEISIFLKTTTSRDDAQALRQPIREAAASFDSKVQLRFVPKENALDQLRSKTGIDDVLATLGNNPLPDSYIIITSGLTGVEDAGKLRDVVSALQQLPGVDVVQIDSAWVEKLAALVQILRLALLFLAIVLGAVVVAVVFNTIRLQVMTQSDEIEVSRLFGATNSFIHRPFYYTGALLGFLAGVVALLIVVLGLLPLNQAITTFARLYETNFVLAPPALLTTSLLLAISALLGLLGARMSVRRHLARLA